MGREASWPSSRAASLSAQLLVPAGNSFSLSFSVLLESEALLRESSSKGVCVRVINGHHLIFPPSHRCKRSVGRWSGQGCCRPPRGCSPYQAPSRVHTLLQKCGREPSLQSLAHRRLRESMKNIKPCHKEGGPGNWGGCMPRPRLQYVGMVWE